MFAFVLRPPPSPPRRGGHPDYPPLGGGLRGRKFKVVSFFALKLHLLKIQLWNIVNLFR
jgi:hypothetical protein